MINGSLTDSVQAVSGVLSFSGGVAAVIVSIYISRKDTRERNKQEELKRKTVLHCIYYMIFDLDDVFNKFERDFKELIFNRMPCISDSVYSHHYNILTKSAAMLKEYTITDMPNHSILLTFVSIRDNINIIIDFADDFKDIHNSGLVCKDDFDFSQSYYQSDFRMMMQAIESVKSDKQRIKKYLGI
ncbi:hypothetical protein [Pectobacterium carotovorum]|uniref:hypothetical protein n=1 Tax=Pectobacterium carotovorum TaxID=554 RepID=UPI00381884DB